MHISYGYLFHKNLIFVKTDPKKIVNMTTCTLAKHFNSLLFGLLFIGFSHLATAQKPVLLEDFNFKTGEKYKRIKNLNSYLFASGDYVVSLKKDRKDIVVQRFALKDLKEDIKKRQTIEDKGDFQTAMLLGDKVVSFYTNGDKLYAQKIAFSKIVAEQPILVGSDKENITNDFGFKSTYGFDAGGRINKFGIKKSRDGSRVVVVFRIKTDDDRADKIGISVYSTSLAKIWSRKVTMPTASGRMEYEDFMVANNGDFYMTASVFNSKDADKNKMEATYNTVLYKITGDEKDIVESQLTLNGKSVTDAVIEENKGKVLIAGFYADNANKKESSGAFIAPVDNTGKISATKPANFPAEKVQQLLAEREARIAEGTQDKDEKMDFENLKVNEIVFSGSNVNIFGEQRYVEVFTTSSSSGSRTTYKYYYRDILALQMSDQGTINWMHLLPKDQIGAVGKRSMSYINLFKEGKHYLFYIDDFVNLKRSFAENPQRYYDGKKEFNYMTAYIINDNTGEVSKEAILTGSDIRNARLDNIELSKHASLSDGSRIFEVFDGKKNYLLVKVSYEK